MLLWLGVAVWGKSGGWWLCLGRVEGWITWGPEWKRGTGVLLGWVGILTRGVGWEGILTLGWVVGGFMWVGWGLVQEV